MKQTLLTNLKPDETFYLEGEQYIKTDTVDFNRLESVCIRIEDGKCLFLPFNVSVLV